MTTNPTLSEVVNSDTISSVPAPRYSTTDRAIREMVLPPVPFVIPGLIYRGCNVISSNPGLGKTTVTRMLTHYLAYGTPLGGTFDAATEYNRCLVFDGETHINGVQEGSWRTTPGELPEGSRDITLMTDETGRPDMPGLTYGQRMVFLRAELEEAAEAGDPYLMTVLDTMKMFAGSRPKGMDVYDWDNQVMRDLDRIGIEFNVGIVPLHHNNKQGDFSGSTGLTGGVSAFLEMAKNPDDDGEIILRHIKNRYEEEASYVLRRSPDGTLRFTDEITVTQAMHTGTNRAVIDTLTSRGRCTMAELYSFLREYERTTIRRCVQRLQGTRTSPAVVRYYRGSYELIGTAPQPPIATVTVVHFCTVCNERMTLIAVGQTTHPSCEPTPEVHPDDARGLDDEEVDQTGWEDETSKGFNAFKSLKDSIKSSKKHPVGYIGPKARQAEGSIWELWTKYQDKPGLSDDALVGEHKWFAADGPAADALVAVLDISGSYPAACSNVNVCANIPRHAGPLAERGDTSGSYLIEAFDWTDPRIGHPLGEMADTAGPWLITTPHLMLLEKLAATGSIPKPVILDSWVGGAVTGLFKPFYEDVRTAREETRDDDKGAYLNVKRGSSKALRMLWCSVGSPWWRPDWSVAIRAEASVRIWAKAWRAVQAGAVLLALTNCDEMHFLAPKDADAEWVPEGYRLGRNYGEIKHKDDVPAGKGLPKLASPLTGAEYTKAVRRD